MFIAKLMIEYKDDFNHILNDMGFIVKILNSYVTNDQTVIDINEVNGLVSESILREIISTYFFVKEFKFLGQTIDKTYFKVKIDWSTSVDLLINNNCFIQFPIICRERKEFWEVLCESKKELKKVIRLLNVEGKKCSLVSIKNYEVYNKGLTSKQLEVLEKAFDSGYFEVPRKINSDEVSKNLKISQATFSVHVQKAISKIVSSYFKK